RLQICSGADALLHAVPRLRRNARRLLARVSSIARLRANAGRVSGRVLSSSRCWNSGHGFRPHAENERVFSLRPAAAARTVAVVQAANWTAIRTTTAYLSIAAGVSVRVWWQPSRLLPSQYIAGETPASTAQRNLTAAARLIFLRWCWRFSARGKD